MHLCPDSLVNVSPAGQKPIDARRHRSIAIQELLHQATFLETEAFQECDGLIEFVVNVIEQKADFLPLLRFQARTLHLPTTKNGDPLNLPLSAFLAGLLTKRKEEADGSPWVFPGPGKNGHLVEIKKFLLRVTTGSGVSFTLHDLRRTFITIAESLDVPYYALKRLLNHRANGDVTGGYIVVNAERLRVPVELVAARILELANVSQ